MGLDHEPQSIEELRARYGAAVESVWDPDLIPDYRPGMLRRHVFDAKDGVRLVIGRETDGEREFIHVSASARETSPLYSSIVAGLESPKQFVKRVRKRFKEISGDERPLTLVGFSKGKGIPHFKLDL